MKLIITGRHMEVKKNLTHYIRKRFSKWAVFLGRDAEVHVILNVEGYRNQVEVTAKDGPYLVTGRQTTKDMFQSVDLLTEKIERQLARKHEKITRRKAPATVRRPSPDEMPTPAGVKSPEIEMEAWSGKPMTAEEAALQLQTMKQSYLIFEEAESGQLAVISKTKNGGFRLISKE